MRPALFPVLFFFVTVAAIGLCCCYFARLKKCNRPLKNEKKRQNKVLHAARSARPIQKKEKTHLIVFSRFFFRKGD